MVKFTSVLSVTYVIVLLSLAVQIVALPVYGATIAAIASFSAAVDVFRV